MDRVDIQNAGDLLDLWEHLLLYVFPHVAYGLGFSHGSFCGNGMSKRWDHKRDAADQLTGQCGSPQHAFCQPFRRLSRVFLPQPPKESVCSKVFVSPRRRRHLLLLRHGLVSLDTDAREVHRDVLEEAQSTL